jgi:hypothetical protein
MPRREGDHIGDVLHDLVRAADELDQWGKRRETSFAALAHLTQQRPDDAQVAALAAQLNAVVEQQRAMVDQLVALQQQVLLIGPPAAGAQAGGLSDSTFEPQGGGRY